MYTSQRVTAWHFSCSNYVTKSALFTRLWIVSAIVRLPLFVAQWCIRTVLFSLKTAKSANKQKRAHFKTRLLPGPTKKHARVFFTTVFRRYNNFAISLTVFRKLPSYELHEQGLRIFNTFRSLRCEHLLGKRKQKPSYFPVADRLRTFELSNSWWKFCGLCFSMLFSLFDIDVSAAFHVQIANGTALLTLFICSNCCHAVNT